MKQVLSIVLFLFALGAVAQSNVEMATDYATGYIDGKYKPYFQSIDGVLYATAQYDFGWILMKYPSSKSDTQYTVHPNTVRIARGAFQGAKALQVIHIPASVKYIGDNAFDDCPSLRAIDCYDGKDPTAVAPAEDDSAVPLPHEVARYNVEGKPCLPSDKGLQIIVFSDFTTQTVVVD